MSPSVKESLESLDVRYIVSDAYSDLKNELQNVGQRFILTSSEADLKLTGEVLNDTASLNKAAIFDESMAKEATIETVLAASFLAGARDEAVLAIVGISAKGRIRPPTKTANLTPFHQRRIRPSAEKAFILAGGWAYRILKKPFELCCVRPPKVGPPLAEDLQDAPADGSRGVSELKVTHSRYFGLML